jgi:hypothetical protein
MTTELEDIRKQIAELATAKTTRRYPSALRQRVTRYARMRLASGVSRAAICGELDVGAPTLERFLKGAPPEGFNRVRVVVRHDDEPGAPRPLTVEGPCGTSIEGLSLNEVAQLFQRLSCSA